MEKDHIGFRFLVAGASGKDGGREEKRDDGKGFSVHGNSLHSGMPMRANFMPSAKCDIFVTLMLNEYILSSRPENSQ